MKTVREGDKYKITIIIIDLKFYNFSSDSITTKITSSPGKCFQFL